MSDVKTIYVVNKESLKGSLKEKPPSSHIEKPNINLATANVFSEVEEYAQFLNSLKSRKVKKILEESKLKVHFHPWTFLDDILLACFLAEYDKFVEDKLKEKYNKVIKDENIKTQIKALKKLQKFVEKVPEIGNKAFNYALGELEKNGIDISIHNGSGASYLPQLLSQYGEELEKAHNYLTSPKSVDHGYRDYSGGLCFPCKQPHGLDKRTPQNIKKDSLLFHLVFICRHHTGGENLPSGTGWHTMPQNLGKPSYPLVKKIAEFILYDGRQDILTIPSVTKCVQRLVDAKAGYFEPSW